MFYNFITKYTEIFVEKMREAKLYTFFSIKILRIWDINVWNFNNTLTNDVVILNNWAQGFTRWATGAPVNAQIAELLIYRYSDQW